MCSFDVQKGTVGIPTPCASSPLLVSRAAPHFSIMITTSITISITVITTIIVIDSIITTTDEIYIYDCIYIYIYES